MGRVHTSNNANSWGFSYNFATAKPMDTRDVVSTYNDLITASTWQQGSAYMNYTGMKVSCADTGKIYVYIGESASATDVVNPAKWIASGSGDSFPILTQEMIEDQTPPDEYIAVSDPTRIQGEITNNTYISTNNGTVVDILFQAVRALQSEVARLKNSFYYGIQSYNGTDTASSNIINTEEQEEKEPLWALDPEDLIEFTDYSVLTNASTLLTPTTNINFKENCLEILGEVSQDIDLNFDTAPETKQCVYITADLKENASIVLNLNESVSFDLAPFCSRDKCNILLIINRKKLNEDTGNYQGKNYIWIQITDKSGNVITTGYLNNSTLSSTEVQVEYQHYIQSVNFNNITLYKCNFYSKESGFTNDDTLSSITPNDNFTYKAAHITIRSVKNKDTLIQLTNRLLENELVLVEQEGQLYIKNKGQLISLSSKSTIDNETMTSEQIIEILKEAGYVTGDGQLNSLQLNAIEKLTFTHSESGQKFNVKVNSDGKLIIDQDVEITPDSWCSMSEDSVDYKKRGAVGHYNLGNNDYEKTVADGALAIYGMSNDPKAKGDRVRFGSWYAPVKNQTEFGCSHDFIELANSGSDDYPLEGSRLFVIKGDIEKETEGTSTNSYLVNASIHKFELTGSIKAGSTYLIRGAKHSGRSFVINVDNYDYELRDNHELFSLEGTMALVLLNASQTPDIAFKTSDTHKANNKLIYYFDRNFWTNSNKGSFSTTVRCDLIDCVGFNDANAFRVFGNSKTGTTQALGSAIYKVGSNQIVKDFFELDPSRQGYLSLTTKDFESTGYRLNKVNSEVLNLNNHNISFPHSDEEASISRFTPRASYENKTICTDKTPLDTVKPNMVSCFYGINMATTRCFAWVSGCDQNEYVWIRKKGDVEWSRFESYKDDSSEISNTNDSYATDVMNRVKYTSTVINSVYKRMKGIFPGSNYNYVGHKCVVYISSEVTNPTTYEYLVGATLTNGNPNQDKCSNIQTFTLYPTTWKPVVYHISDQQGFEWTEYQVWAAAAKKILEKINEECTVASNTFPVLINSGDCTQNGTRYNEWLDYYNAGYYLFDHLEQMNVVGNNDLANAYDHSVLGTGNDEGKSNPYYFHLVNCYELDNTANFAESEDVYESKWQHPLIYNNTFFPSTYYTYFGNYGYVMINSELTVDMCKGLYKAVNGERLYNLYTGYLENSTDFDFSSVTRCFKNTISNMLDKLQGKKIIVNCHEMPFTVITAENLSAASSSNPRKLDRSCNGDASSSVTHTSLVGSHMNRIHFSSSWNDDDNYWFSQLLQDKGVKLCLGGHKHSYACTYPIYEKPIDVIDLLSEDVPGVGKRVISDFADYDKSKLFITLVDSNKLNHANAELVKDSVYKWTSGDAYPLLRASDSATLNGVKMIDKAVTYFMVQATGYKLKSNKELPSVDQSFSNIRPKTVNNNGKLSAHFSQESPMFATIKDGGTTWNIDLYRVINIKKTEAIAVKEFSSVNYSTKPVILERLVLKYNTVEGVNENYWYTQNDSSDYDFDYTTTESDRCWEKNGNNVSIYGGSIPYQEHTLTVKL